MKKLLTIAAALLLVSLVYRSSAGATINLAGAQDLSGAIAQSMYTGGGKTTLPVPGKDFNLKSINYFDNRSWAVAAVAPINDSFDPGITILKADGGVFRVVVPPTSQLPSSSSAVLPKDVVNFLKTYQPIYEPRQ